MPARDEQRVLAVEADAAARGRLAVDVLVRVDEDAVRAADAPAELVELLPQAGVRVEPRVARQAAVPGGALRLGQPVAERRRDDRARAGQQRLGMARLLGPRHREAHVGEEPARAALADVPLGLGVRLGAARRRSRRARAPSPSAWSSAAFTRIVCRGAAVRIHEDGGPEVLVLEEVPDPAPAPGEVLVRLHASALNHLDVWIRKGLPSVPKPRILGADGAGVVEALGEATVRAERVVINPGIETANGAIHVIGEHGDGTNAELIAVPATNVHPIPGDLSFEEAAAFPLVFETAYRMLVTRARLQEGEWVLVWGIGSGVSTAALAIAKALGARIIVTSSSDAKLERARELGADLDRQPRDRATSTAAVKEATGGHGADVVVDHVGEATWKHRSTSRAREGRITVCGATTGPNPPAALHRDLVEAAVDPRLDDGDAPRTSRAPTSSSRAAARARSSTRSSRSRRSARRTSGSRPASSSARSSSRSNRCGNRGASVGVPTVTGVDERKPRCADFSVLAAARSACNVRRGRTGSGHAQRPPRSTGPGPRPRVAGEGRG